PPKDLGGKVVVRRGQAAVRDAPLGRVREARSSLLLARSSCASSWLPFLRKNLFLQDLAEKNAETKNKSDIYRINMEIPPK
ncbi:unnamed protein product, partial [Microthlaspi erraticum]